MSLNKTMAWLTIGMLSNCIFYEIPATEKVASTESVQDRVVLTKDIAKNMIQNRRFNKSTKLDIDDEYTEIADGAFENCNYLTEVTIPSKVKSIGASAFSTAVS